MNEQDLRRKYFELYDYMARSRNTEHMKTFGKVMTEMYDWFVTNKPSAAQTWLEKLECIIWDNYLTSSEAESIVNEMIPEAPWSMEQWRNAMTKHGFEVQRKPCYNCHALWVVMNMIMSDSSSTLSKYVDSENLFSFVHDLSIDKLCDEDKKFSLRRYFSL